MAEQKPRLEMKGISKSFPGVRALSNVDFRLFAGEVHALMGENGAGKSTLIKTLTGVHPIDSGDVFLDSKKIYVGSPLDAQDQGISTVYQEVNLCTNLSVAENIFIGREPRKFGRIQWKEMQRRAKELLEGLHVSIDVTKSLSVYSVALQQMVAIARALNVSAKVLILDEPTSSLDTREVNELFKVMRKLKADGLAILFVTHFMDQVYEISDRITVLRNGELVGEYMTEELPRIQLISKMIGKEWDALEDGPKSQTKEVGQKALKPILEAKGVGRKGSIEPFDMTLNSGEVVGLAGLLGSGRTEIARVLFGADKSDSGSVRFGEKDAQLTSPRQAIDRGMAFCSENRKTEGIIGDLTIRENIVLALQATRGWYRYLTKTKQTEIADNYIRLLNINPPNPEHLVKNLSGGNQQKVILARWLLTEPKLLILDEPTRGIDIGAKTEIQKLILKLCEEGMSILFISSELEEVLRVSGRIAVLRDHHKVTEMQNQNISHKEIMQAIAGGGAH
ncbi:sugar ABC transporter ATP-binding protein [Paenibacillus hexagrammi]|uniref:Sugar ABC transporter ATP-binding protein n=1 Tax=Paenibacillus hexagrammi TaxID=2908839 RepID=A0ABY3SGH0_9BACL|nr:sugar ABC transporter ATP-binding protein [Paenibacillus sp. YPD9-1]UJF32563.1 sugar ABC transporter ATP-binding protein [Paenibacillus sp. YPD9-1]